MSRSRKKYGIIKDGGSWSKQYSNQKFRSRNKHALRSVIVSGDYDELQLFNRNELVNQWDICDWKSHWGGDQVEWEGMLKRFSRGYYRKDRTPLEVFRSLKREYFNK